MLADSYLQLTKAFAQTSLALGQPIVFPLPQVAEVLGCTTRNANLLLKRMMEQEWLVWVPGRGRGNGSRLTLLQDPEALILAQCSELLQAGRLREAFASLEQHAVSAHGRTQFLQQFSAQLGRRTEQGEAQQIDVLRYPFDRSLETLDPFFLSRRTENQLVRQVMEGLVEWNQERGIWEGQLAHAWEVDASGRVYTFYLRKGVQFHHGQELTAEDVQATFTRLLDPELASPYRDLFACLADIHILGRYAIRFSLHEPLPLFVNLLGLTCATIQPRDRFKQEELYGRMPVGTGPFQIERNDEEQFVLTAFPHYYRGRPFLDRVEMWVVPDPKEWNHILELGGQEIYYLFGGHRTQPSPDWQRAFHVEAGCKMIVWNFNRSGPQHDPLFRQAFRVLIDQERMVQELGQNRARQAFGLLPRAQVGTSWPRLTREARVAEAKRLLQACGYQGEALTVLTYESLSNREDLLWLADCVGEAGIRLIPDVRNREEFMQPERMQEVHLVCTGWVAMEDEELSLYDNCKSQSPAFRTPLGAFWQDQLDQKLAQIMHLNDASARRQAYLELEAWLLREELVIWLYHSSVTNYYHPQLKGAVMGVQGYVDFRKLWWGV